MEARERQGKRAGGGGVEKGNWRRKIREKRQSGFLQLAEVGHVRNY